MKKFFFFLMNVLFVCGFAWAAEGSEAASGVKVSGTVSIKAGKLTYVRPNFKMTVPDTVYLRKEGVELKSLIDGSDYAFENVAAGVYELSYAAVVKEYAAVFFTKSVTVGAENVSLDIEAVDDPKRVGLEIMPQYKGDWSNMALGDVQIVCTKGNETQIKYNTSKDEGWRITAPPVHFICDTAGEYTIRMRKEGYLDTTFKVKALKEYSISDSVSKGKTLNVVMREDPRDKVKVKGEVAVNGNSEAKLKGLSLVLSFEDRMYLAEIKDGKYEFAENIPVGKYVYYLVTGNAKILANRTKNWRFVEGGLDSLSFEASVSEGEQVVTKDVEVERVAVDVKGLVVSKKEEGKEPARLVGVKVVIGNDTYRDSAESEYNGFLMAGVKDGTYTLEYTKVGYRKEQKSITVDMSKMAWDSAVTVEDVTLFPSGEADYSFVGQIQYPVPDQPMVKVENATVEMYDMEGVKLKSTSTDADGKFKLEVRCLIGTEFRFKVFHESIDTATVTATVEAEENSVPFSIIARIPELFGMINARAEQIGHEPMVRLNWEWPETLKDQYVDAEGEGVYRISQVLIYRALESETNSLQIGRIEQDFLTTTHFVDSAKTLSSGENAALKLNETYSYYFQVKYAKPFAYGKPDNVVVKDAGNLTLTLRDDSVVLTLKVNQAEYGQVSGAGKYKTGDTADIKAVANTGYEFVAWISGADTVARSAEFTLIMLGDSTLTAVFAKKDVANGKTEQAQWEAYAENGQIVLRSNTFCHYEVYSTAGIRVRQGALNGECRVVVRNSGLYLVRRISSTGISVKKVMVR